MMNEKKQYVRAVATVLAIFALGQIPGSIDAAIAKIAEAFSLTSSSALYVTTVASLTSVFFGLLIGWIAGRKLTYRTIILLCASIEVIGALLPFWCKNFSVILLVRACFGIGGMMSLENTMATLLIPIEKRPRILGFAMFCGFGSNCLLQWVGGLLADIAWNYVFLTHLFLLIPFTILWICCPKIALEKTASQSTDLETDSLEKLPKLSIGIAFVMMIIGVLIAPLLIGCSFLSAQIIDSATVAGLVAVCFSVGCMSGGLLYPVLYQRFQRRSLTIFFILTAIGSLGCALTRNIGGLCGFIFMSGIGFSLTQSCLMMLVGFITPPKKIAIASALFMAMFNLGMFGSGLFEHGVGIITGDALYFPLYIGTAVFLFFAVLFFIRSPFPQNQTVYEKNHNPSNEQETFCSSPIQTDQA